MDYNVFFSRIAVDHPEAEKLTTLTQKNKTIHIQGAGAGRYHQQRERAHHTRTPFEHRIHLPDICNPTAGFTAITKLK